MPFRKPHAILLLGSLLLPGAPGALAAPLKLEDACPGQQKLKSEIFICGDNELAAQAAQKCSEAVFAGWKAAGAALAPLLETGASGHASQKQLERNTAGDYEKALATLDSQIALLEKYSDEVADYSLVMLDFPGATDDETSADCFNSAFHSIQETVDKMDDELTRAKKLRAEAHGLAGRARHAEAGLGAAAAGTEKLSQVTGKAEKGLLPTGQSEAAQSEVTSGELGLRQAAGVGAVAAIGAAGAVSSRAPAVMPSASLVSAYEPEGAGGGNQSDPGLAGTRRLAAASGATESVGAILWRKSGNRLKADFGLQHRGNALSGEASVPGSVERTLFEVVHLRYTKTELFRNSR